MKKIIAGVIILGVAGLAYLWWGTSVLDINKESNSLDNQDIQARDEEAQELATTTVTKELDYQDGEYRSDIVYPVPNGSEHDLHLEVTLQEDVITNINLFFDDEKSGTSDSTKQDFIDNVTPLVVGEDIDSLELSRVGGASLTTEAFNKALAQIKTQAQL